MQIDRVLSALFLVIGLAFLPLSWSTAVSAQQADAVGLLTELDEFPHTTQVSHVEDEVVDYEIGLGAMRKQLGSWRFKHSHRMDGERLRYTWQVIDGFSSGEVAQALFSKLDTLPESSLLFGCEGRACGNGAQWASRVFGERILYGRAESQLYRVYRIGDQTQGSYLLVYAAARTADRQYLHAELVVSASQFEE